MFFVLLFAYLLTSYASVNSLRTNDEQIMNRVMQDVGATREAREEIQKAREEIQKCREQQQQNRALLDQILRKLK